MIAYEIFDKKDQTPQSSRDYLAELERLDTEQLAKLLCEWFDSFLEREFIDWEKIWKVGLDIENLNKLNIDDLVYSWLGTNKLTDRKIIVHSFLHGYWGARGNISYDAAKRIVLNMGTLNQGIGNAIVDKLVSMFNSRKKREIWAWTLEIESLLMILNRENIEDIDLKKTIFNKLLEVHRYLKIVASDEIANDVMKSLRIWEKKFD